MSDNCARCKKEIKEGDSHCSVECREADIDYLATRIADFRVPVGHNIPTCECQICRETYFHTAWMYL